MSFRERSAWITLVSVLLCFGVYFGSIAAGHVSAHRFGTFHLLLHCVAALVLLQCLLHFVASRLSPGEGRAPRDERERLIAWRSHSIGYQALMVGVLLLGAPVHFGRPSPPELMNLALLAIVVAVLVTTVAQIVMFRRGV
jgi:drug/metabolite transporter (DMT)-like permease